MSIETVGLLFLVGGQRRVGRPALLVGLRGYSPEVFPPNSAQIRIALDYC